MDINADFHYLALLTLSKGTYVIQRYLRYPKVLTLSKGTSLHPIILQFVHLDFLHVFV